MSGEGLHVGEGVGPEALNKIEFVSGNFLGFKNVFIIIVDGALMERLD